MSSREPESVPDAGRFSADLAEGLERCRELIAEWRLKIGLTEAQAFASGRRMLVWPTSAPASRNQASQALATMNRALTGTSSDDPEQSASAALSLILLAALALGACGPGRENQAPEEAAANRIFPEAATRPATGFGDAGTPSRDSPVLTATGRGPLRIGMTLAEVTAAAGRDSSPEAPGGADPAACDQFRPARAPEGLLVMIEDGKLTRISLINGSNLKTSDGLRLGDPKARVLKVLGARAITEPHKYGAPPAAYVTTWTRGPPSSDYVRDPDARGIRYEISSAGVVGSIHAGGPSIQYVEGCS